VTDELYAHFRSGGAARERFRSDPVIDRLWPPDLQRIIREVDDSVRDYPSLQLHMAIGFFASRDYERAILALERARALPGERRRALGLQIYALCLLGRVQDAQLLASEHRDQLLLDGRLPRSWSFLQRQFGIDPQSVAQSGPARDRAVVLEPESGPVHQPAGFPASIAPR
jgi:hypothetical protein